MAIGTGFGNGRAKWTVDETSNQNTRAPHGQSSISTTSSMTFQALAPATHDQVLTLYHTIPVRRAAPPRFALETSMLLGDFIAFKMDDIQDGVSVASEYKKSVYKLFFGDDYVTPVEKTVSALLSGYFPFS